MDKIIFGSHDSLDIDVVYVFDTLPSLQECKKFCENKDEENKNIVCIKNGVVVSSYKGTIDEMNNVILDTFHLHKQNMELNPITKRLERDILMKNIRTLRGVFSQLSRTLYREKIKQALKSNDWKLKLEVLDSIDLNKIDDFEKASKIETYKFLAFQFGQTFALFEGKEFYTKKDLANEYVTLRPYLYREEKDIQDLQKFMKLYINTLKDIYFKQKGENVYFIKENKLMNLKEEKYVLKNDVKNIEI